MIGDSGARTIICMDTNFTDSSRFVSRKGAQLIAAPTFDATPGIAEQMWTHAVMRTVENRVAMVKTGHRYGSAIIDSYGRLVKNTLTLDGEELILVDDVRLGTANTLVMRIPDWLGWVSLAGFVFFMVYMEREKKNQKKAAGVASEA
jgi:apolipoprotein N-acyltransferase